MSSAASAITSAFKKTNLITAATTLTNKALGNSSEVATANVDTSVTESPTLANSSDATDAAARLAAERLARGRAASILTSSQGLSNLGKSTSVSLFGQ